MKKKIDYDLKMQLLSNGFTEEQILYMWCPECGNFGFDCTCTDSDKADELAIDCILWV